MELAKLSTRILYDTIPNVITKNNNNNSIVYCFAHNDLNIPLMAKKIVEKNFNLPNYILDNKYLMSGVNSCDCVKEKYAKYNLNFETIPYDENWINTKIESDAVIKWTINKRIKNIIVCAPIFHIVRAYMTIVSSLIDSDSEENINIYALPADIMNWGKKTITHQGKNINTFNNFIEIELKRIEDYTLKSDIKLPNKIWDYILFRDERCGWDVEDQRKCYQIHQHSKQQTTTE